MVSVCHLEQCVCASWLFFSWYKNIVKSGIKHVLPTYYKTKTFGFDISL